LASASLNYWAKVQIREDVTDSKKNKWWVCLSLTRNTIDPPYFVRT